MILTFVVFAFRQVTYCVNGFMDKNNDLLYRDLSQCMYACGHPLAKTLFPDGKIAKGLFTQAIFVAAT